MRADQEWACWSCEWEGPASGLNEDGDCPECGGDARELGSEQDDPPLEVIGGGKIDRVVKVVRKP
jgi:hypothetical protein